jgi:hypothetical protein
MNINPSYMEKLLFHEKPNNGSAMGGGGGGGDPLYANIDNESPYPTKVFTGVMTISNILSKSTPHIKALSHLGLPAGLITTPFPAIRGGGSNGKKISTQKLALHDDKLTNALFSKIEHAR